jgi:hypothetical protein
MGFPIMAGEYGRFIPQESPFPTFCSPASGFFRLWRPGASTSGYYAAKALLAAEGISLDAELGGRA